MNGLTAFLKKELLEQIRCYKAVILWTVLLLFGMTSPLFAKMMPDILAHMSTPGITITVPQATVMDAWEQYFKNISQMGVVVLLLVYSGTLSQELTKGTLVIPLSKGLSRGAVILSKFLAPVLVWTVGYAVSAAVSCAYTQYLFGRFAEPNMGLSLLGLWLFGCFLIAALILGSLIVPGNYGGLLLTAFLLGVLLIGNLFPKFEKWNPATIASANAALLKGTYAAGDLWVGVGVTLVLTALFLVISSVCFQRKTV